MNVLSDKMACKWCGKEYLVENYKSSGACRGALNLHERSCEIKYLRAKVNEGQKTPTGEEPRCEHSWRFLNRNVPEENNAISHNYKEVCVKCQELR